MTTKRLATSGIQAATDLLRAQLVSLKLAYVLEHFESLLQQAGAEQWPHVDYLARLIEGEAHRREDRSILRRVGLARFPVIKTLDTFDWGWPKKINRPQIQNLFHLRFIEDKANVIFISNVGLGKSHLSIALGHTACLRGFSVLFTTAVDIINSLSAAQAHGNLKRELHKYLQPRLLVVDELGYLPIDKHGADLLFQVISGRYERGAIIITSNRAYKHWPEIFNNDSTLSQRGAQAATITAYPPGAPALRKMPVKKFGNDRFVNALHPQTSATRPLGEVGNAAHAIAERGRRVATVSQVLLVRINVRRKRSPGKPVDTVS